MTQYKRNKLTLYCTIDGVKTPVVYKNSRNYFNSEDGFLDNVTITSDKRLAQQQSLKQTTKPINVFTETITTTTTTPQGGTVTTTSTKTIAPIFIFDYTSGIREDAGQVVRWASQNSSLSLEQTTQANRPFLGITRKGVVGSSSVFFHATEQSFLRTSSDVTLTGDFTLFAYLHLVPLDKLNKYVRILGNSGDANMFLIARETDTRYELSFTSSSEAEANVSSIPFNYKDGKFLLSLIRKKDRLSIRENGVEVADVSCPTDDFTFNQIGRVGTSVSTLNGGIYHLSAYNEAISDELTSIEDAIIRTSEFIK
jgi:hypothetical protein